MAASGEVAFIFVYVAKRPRTKAELEALPAVRKELERLVQHSRSTGSRIRQTHVATTTYRRRRFVDTREFQEAVASAINHGATLILGDLAGLMSQVPASELDAVMARLDRLECDVFDATSGITWRSFSVGQRLAIIGAVAAKAKTARAISRGRQTGSGANATVDRTSNQQAGAKANQVRAVRDAERLRPIVDELRAEQPDGMVPPSVLARRLNDLGIPTPRAGEWSINTAKRLLARLS